MKIKGLIFDIDGVITETAVLHYEAWKKEVEKIGINYTEDVNVKFKGFERMKTLNCILEYYDVAVSTEEKKKMAKSKNDYYIGLLKNKLTKNDVLPGMEKLLSDAKSMNLKIAAASSSHNAPLILKNIGLIDYFDFIVNPQNVINGKPDPEIYLRAAKGINLQPKECIGFEDAIAGIDGLHSAGIKTIAITHGDKNNWSKADIVFESTESIRLINIL